MVERPQNRRYIVSNTKILAHNEILKEFHTDFQYMIQ